MRSRLLLVQYTQDCCAIVESVLYTHAYYSYNTHKPVVRLLRALRTVTVISRTIHKPVARLLTVLRTLMVITRTIHTRLFCDC